MNIARFPYRTDMPRELDPLAYRTVYMDLENKKLYTNGTNVKLIYPKMPVGMYLDKGSVSHLWDYTSECYGHGVCAGLVGNWECQCFGGYSGNCNSGRSCPTGHAWFHKPTVDNIAHDDVVECSNMGICDRSTGDCTCRDGFAGAACERMSCPGVVSSAGYTGDYAAPSLGSPCNNAGRYLPI